MKKNYKTANSENHKHRLRNNVALYYSNVGFIKLRLLLNLHPKERLL